MLSYSVFTCDFEGVFYFVRFVKYVSLGILQAPLNVTSGKIEKATTIAVKKRDEKRYFNAV